MSIETLDDWNLVITQCGKCCGMPECPEPVMVCESKSGSASSTPYLPFVDPGVDEDEFIPTMYVTRVTDGFSSSTGVVKGFTVFDNGVFSEEILDVDTYDPSGNTLTHEVNSYRYSTGVCTNTVTPRFTFLPAGSSVDLDLPDPECTETTQKAWEFVHQYLSGTEKFPQGCPGPFSSAALSYYRNLIHEGGTIKTLSTPLTLGDMASEVDSEIAVDDWSSGAGCIAEYATTWPKKSDIGAWAVCGSTEIGRSVSVSKNSIRARFKIPSSHPGSYFKITYDIAEFPTDETILPSFVSEDNTVEWTGPGTGLPTDPSWLTDWFTIDAPTEPGERRVVNIRYTCRKGIKFGVKPQVMGEAFELPEEEE